jgi:5-methylcytosine-specific restriction endonuclease McrA
MPLGREQIGTTKRSKLTPLQRLALFEAFDGKCALCGEPLGDPKDPWIDEHLARSDFGGTNKLKNRAPVHFRCAAVKTEDDMRRIRKAKRQKARAVGAYQPQSTIPSRPLPTPVKVKKPRRKAANGEPEIMRRARKRGRSA